MIFSQALFPHNTNVAKKIDEEGVGTIIINDKKSCINKSINYQKTNMLTWIESPNINQVVT